jgi:hypothetical protein
VILPGDIGFAGRRSGFYPSAVRWFTNSKWSHCFVVMPEYMGELSVLEADLKVQLVPFREEYVHKDEDYYEIWRPKKASIGEKLSACHALYLSSAGGIYGFMQILWFAVRQGLLKLGINLPGKNWFPGGEICSETLWVYLVYLGGHYRGLFEGMGRNEVSPQDLRAAMQSRPDLFEFVYERK